MAEELQHRQRVVGGPVQADVARHRGDAAQFQPGVTAAERDRERVVDARVAVEEDLPGRHGSVSRWRAASGPAHRPRRTGTARARSPRARRAAGKVPPPARRRRRALGEPP